MEWSDPSIAEGMWKLAGALDKALHWNGAGISRRAFRMQGCARGW